MTPTPFILASQSPRRRQLLQDAGYAITVLPPDERVESDDEGEGTPRQLVQRLARKKAEDVARHVATGIVLGCDTVAECQGQVLGKPADREHARQMLELLRGQIHYVHSGLCLWRRPDDRVAEEVDTTVLQMAEISDSELTEYLDSGAWQGKAGAFGYQDRLHWLRIVTGSESNVVGLPLELLERLLHRL